MKDTMVFVGLGPDDRQYDAVGVELEWKVWER